MSREIKSSRAIPLKINKIRTNVTSDESLIETNLNLCMSVRKIFCEKNLSNSYRFYILFINRPCQNT